MSLLYGARGNQPVAVQAAQEFLQSGGTAVGAVLSGFFAACGAYAGILLGPLSLLVAGTGTGVRAFDGRLRQPGLGTKRPRGFLSEAEIPPAARIGVPRAIAAAVVAHAYDRSGPIAQVLKRGIRQARQVGSETRAELLQSIRGLGAGVISSPSFARPLLRVAGIAEGGLLTSADLASIVDLDLAAQSHPALEDWLEAPWASNDFPSLAYSDPEASAPPDATKAETMSGKMRSSDTLLMVLCAVDARGVFAGATYTWTTNGITIDELDLELPTHAIPVMRGVTRIAPGSALPSAAPIAVRMERGRPIAMVGDPKSDRLDREGINQAQFRLIRDPETRVVTICD